MNLEHRDIHHLVSEAEVEPFQVTNSGGKKRKRQKRANTLVHLCSIFMITVPALNLRLIQLCFKNKNEVSIIWQLTKEIFPKLNTNAKIHISHLCNCMQHTRRFRRATSHNMSLQTVFLSY